MTIEERLASLEAAIKELTAALKGKAGGGGSKADDAIEKEAARKAAADKGGAAKGKAYAQRFKDYISVEDEDEQQTRIANIQKIAKKFNVKKPSLIEESDWPEALKMLKKLEDAAKAGDDETEEDTDSLV